MSAGDQLRALARWDHLCTRITIQENGCHVWTGAVSGGYGKTYIGNRRIERVHRIAWAVANGRWPPSGYDVHHECGCTVCVNPDHLRLLSTAEHRRLVRITDAHASHREAAKTRCPQGHEYSRENTYLRANGHRVCRTCARDYKRLARFRALTSQEPGA